MRKLLILLILSFVNLSVSSDSNNEARNCKATYYDTQNHKKVHRPYPTAAFNNYKRNTKLLVTNLKNNIVDTVVITDKHGMGSNHIDLSIMAFDRLTKLDTISNIKKRESKRKSIGTLKVIVKLIK